MWTSAMVSKTLPAAHGRAADIPVALAHVRALTIPEASGQRFISSAGPASPNDLCLVCAWTTRESGVQLIGQAIHRHFPQFKDVPSGDSSKAEEINAASNLFDGTKATRILGITYRNIDTTVKDMGECLIQKFDL
jgi:hypothetical protein